MSAIISNIVPTIRILKVETCPTSSAKATLTYHIGCTTDKDIQFRIVANTGGGLFSHEWISLSAIHPAFQKAPTPLTSFPLINLYQGKSTNTPGFLMAVLKHEGLVCPLEGKIRGYEILDSKPFMDEINALMASDINIEISNFPAKQKPPVASKKPSEPIINSATSIKTKKSNPPIETSNTLPEPPKTT